VPPILTDTKGFRLRAAVEIHWQTVPQFVDLINPIWASQAVQFSKRDDHYPVTLRLVAAM